MGWFHVKFTPTAAQYEDVEFSGWEKFSNSYAVDLPPDGKYLEGHVILIFWKVIERLIAAGDLGPLNLVVTAIEIEAGERFALVVRRRGDSQSSILMRREVVWCICPRRRTASTKCSSAAISIARYIYD